LSERRESPSRLRRATGITGDVLAGTALVFCIPFVILAVGTPIVLGVRFLLWIVGMP